jgi:hypothetical protein
VGAREDVATAQKEQSQNQEHPDEAPAAAALLEAVPEEAAPTDDGSGKDHRSGNEETEAPSKTCLSRLINRQECQEDGEYRDARRKCNQVGEDYHRIADRPPGNPHESGRLPTGSLSHTATLPVAKSPREREPG